ncbi:MAG TPA: sugar ABC transporter permease [Thermotogota bacterium]|nr:sugar ABC transporter permease [Thermotogota bacterium]HPJ88822.1 sugar ABC transporter permease [Thermotogota bacterium]HPR96685.1 sugar ABC transporter permease [Thermotogota bacterium]
MKNRKKGWFIFWMLLPVFSVIGFLSIYPTIKGIILAFQNYTVFTFNRIKFIGWDNFEEIIMDPDFLPIVWNTVVWIVVSVFFQLILGLGLALLLRKPFKGRGVYSGLVFYPWALSGFAIGLLWSWLLNGQFGIVNDILIKMNLIQEGIQFLSEPNMAMFSVLLVNIWYGIPFFAIMSLAALQSIPETVYEAAEIDGANAWNKLFKITLPYIRPTIVSTVLVRSIWIMNFPDVIYGMTRGGPAKSTEILSTHMINIIYYENDYSKASAVGVIITVFLLLYTVLYLKFSGSKEVEI